MSTFDIEWAKAVLLRVRQIMEEQKSYLNDLDGAMGDGDLGLTMTKGFIAADEEARESAETDIGKLFSKAGMVMAKAAPSTMGTLIGSGFMRAGKALVGKTSLETPDLASFFSAFVEGLMQRGKSQLGEKTVIDALNPVAVVLQGAGDRALADVLPEMLVAAKEGLEATKDMVAQHGRVAYYQEQSKGKQDPGATAGVFIIQGFVEGGTE